MNFGKKTILCLAGVLSCQTGVYALELGDINKVPVTVTGKTDAGIPVAATVEDAEGNYYFFDEIKSSEDGSYILEFELPENLKNKTMTVEIRPHGKSEETVSFEFSGSEIRKQATEAWMQAVDAKDKDALLAVIDNEDFKVSLEMMGIPVSELDAVKEDAVSEICASGTNEETFAEDFNRVCFVLSLKKGNDDGIEAFFENSDYVFDGVAYNDETDSNKKAWVKKNMLDSDEIKTVSDAEDMYEKLSVYYLVNNAKYTELPDLIKEYREILEVDGTDTYEEFDGMSTKNKNKVAEKIVTMKGFGNINDDFESYLEKGVDEVKDSDKSGGSSGGSGGGGGSSSGGNWVPAGIKNENQQTQTPSESEKGKFSDVDKNSWYYSAVSELNEKGIVTGKTENTFSPDDFVTREEFLAMIIRTLGKQNEQSGANLTFSDVVPGAWYENIVKTAVSLELASGYSEDTFGIGDLITRQDAAVFAMRSAKLMGFELGGGDETLFTDDADISDYAKDGVYKMKNAGIISGMGDGSYSPKTNCTRAQAAVIVHRLLKGGSN